MIIEATSAQTSDNDNNPIVRCEHFHKFSFIGVFFYDSIAIQFYQAILSNLFIPYSYQRGRLWGVWNLMTRVEGMLHWNWCWNVECQK